MSVAKSLGTTNFDTIECDFLYCGGTIVGSALVPATIDSTSGTLIGSVINVTTLNCKGSTTGSVVNSGTMNVTSGLFVGAGVSGTIIGSVSNSTIENVKGTFTGSVATIGTANITSLPTNDAVGFATLTGTSKYFLVGTIVGSQAHGLAGAPVAVMIAPVMDFGTFGAPYQRAAADGTNCFVSAGTTGTVQITALA
jgi:hypothetical protein